MFNDLLTDIREIDQRGLRLELFELGDPLLVEQVRARRKESGRA